MTRTFSPFNSRVLAMIEPVFLLAPKITYMPFKATGEIIASGLSQRVRYYGCGE
jgi:hypothetical protein